jgi:hypothetical protein
VYIKSKPVGVTAEPWSTVLEEKTPTFILGPSPKIKKLFKTVQQFGCSTAASQQQMALNFELVASDQLFSAVLASCK